MGSKPAACRHARPPQTRKWGRGVVTSLGGIKVAWVHMSGWVQMEEWAMPGHGREQGHAVKAVHAMPMAWWARRSGAAGCMGPLWAATVARPQQCQWAGTMPAPCWAKGSWAVCWAVWAWAASGLGARAGTVWALRLEVPHGERCPLLKKSLSRLSRMAIAGHCHGPP